MDRPCGRTEGWTHGSCAADQRDRAVEAYRPLGRHAGSEETSNAERLGAWRRWTVRQPGDLSPLRAGRDRDSKPRAQHRGSIHRQAPDPKAGSGEGDPFSALLRDLVLVTPSDQSTISRFASVSRCAQGIPIESDLFCRFLALKAKKRRIPCQIPAAGNWSHPFGHPARSPPSAFAEPIGTAYRPQPESK